MFFSYCANFFDIFLEKNYFYFLYPLIFRGYSREIIFIIKIKNHTPKAVKAGAKNENL